MKRIIEYHEVLSDHILAMPEYLNEELVEFDAEEDLDEYIKSQKDFSGDHYKKNKDYNKPNSLSSKFKYTSKRGGVVVRKSKQRKAKKI